MLQHFIVSTWWFFLRKFCDVLVLRMYANVHKSLKKLQINYFLWWCYFAEEGGCLLVWTGMQMWMCQWHRNLVCSFMNATILRTTQSSNTPMRKLLKKGMKKRLNNLSRTLCMPTLRHKKWGMERWPCGFTLWMIATFLISSLHENRKVLHQGSRLVLIYIDINFDKRRRW